MKPPPPCPMFSIRATARPSIFNRASGATPREPEASGRGLQPIGALRGGLESAAIATRPNCRERFPRSGIWPGACRRQRGFRGFIVPDRYSNDVIEFLRPASVVRARRPHFDVMPGGNLFHRQRHQRQLVSVKIPTLSRPPSRTFGQVALTARK